MFDRNAGEVTCASRLNTSEPDVSLYMMSFLLFEEFPLNISMSAEYIAFSAVPSKEEESRSEAAGFPKSETVDNKKETNRIIL